MKESQRQERMNSGQRTFSGTLFGMYWSLSLQSRGGANILTLPNYVGTEEIISLPQNLLLKFDFEHTYLTAVDNRPATCRVRVYSPGNEMLQRLREGSPGVIGPITYRQADPTIILCEPLAVGGITNRAEEIATAVWHQLGRPQTFLWIEHWWKSSFSEFLRVRFRCTAQGVLVDPEWTVVQPSEVGTLIGPIQEINDPTTLVSLGNQ